MQSLSPLSEKELKKYNFLFKTVKANMGFVPESMKAMARIPAVMANFSMLSGILIADSKKTNPFTAFILAVKNMFWSLAFLNKKERIPLHLRNLVAHVSSNASGCRYCQAHTISEASHNGATKEQLESVWDFENSNAFSEAEKAALRFGFAAGSVPNSVNESHFVELQKYYTEENILELGAIVSLFGFLNRWNDTFGTTLEQMPLDKANKYLKKSGWEIGKHT